MSCSELTLLRVENLAKRFPGVVALDGVTFNLLRGEVHALVGENGAGKSTFIKILGGVLKPDGGMIEYDGSIISHLDPYRARSIGISIIHQESELAPELSAADNIFMGRELGKGCGWYIDSERMNCSAQEWLDRVGADFSPTALVRDLSISQRRLLEVARAISMDAKILIMDEPTTAFTDKEVERLFEIIRTLKAQGVTTLYISHRLNEIYSIADRVTVLRDGQVIATQRVEETREDELIRLMVGHELKRTVRTRSTGSDVERLSVSGLTKEGLFEDITFSVNKGEIVGLCGLLGSGSSEVGKALFGVFRNDKGTVLLDGERLEITTPADAINHGIAYIPADRKRDGLLLRKPIKENISLPSLDRLSQRSVINLQREHDEAIHSQSILRIKAPSINEVVMNLSGGNQQKVLFARWLLMQAKLLILEDPTAGIDVGAKQEVYDLMNQLAEKGCSMILISSDLPEVLDMCDRILVLRDGHIAREVPREEATQEVILYYSTGLHEKKASQQ